MKRWAIRVLIGLAAAIALAVAVLAAMGLRQEAGVPRASIDIKASREQLWPWIEEAERFKQWVSLVTSVEVLNPDVKGVGRRTVVLMNEPRSPEPVRIESVWTV